MDQLPKGKKPASYHANDLRFTEYRSSTAPIVVPQVFGHGNTFQDWGMLGNDDYGDCVWAGGDHETRILNYLGGKTVTFTRENALADYASTGFNPQTGANDNGTDVHQAMDYRVNTGLIDSNGQRHKIKAYVALEPGNMQHLLEAIYLFDAVGIGIEFPDFAMDQFNRNQVWSVVAGAPAPSEGHYIPLMGVPAVGNLACITWGRRQIMTNDFYRKYCDEAYAYITEESLNAKRANTTYEGFNWQQLTSDLPTVA